MYKQYIDSMSGVIANFAVIRVGDGVCIPFVTDNTDFQRFKQDIANGAELLDAEGNVMTAEQVQAFLSSLP